MTVTMDVDRTWKVACDADGCHQRLYLVAAIATVAAGRARREYGWHWVIADDFTAVQSVFCSVHGSPR